MAISPSQYLFLWQSIPLLLNAIYVSAFPDRWLHPSCLPHENTIPALHVSRFVPLFPFRAILPEPRFSFCSNARLHITIVISSELSLTVAAYFLLAAYRRDHGMMKLAIPLRVLAFIIGVRDGGMWVRVGLYELVMGVLTAWAVSKEGGW